MLKYGLIGGGLLCTKLYFMGGVNHHNPDLSGKTVLVTGGNSGIGKEAARRFYELNADVIITGRSSKKAKEFLKELKRPSDKQKEMEFVQVDFSDLKQVKQFAEALKGKHDKLDLLVNNAGCSFTKYRADNGIELQMKINHLAPTYLTSQLLPLLENAGEARIVTLSSLGHKGPNSAFVGGAMEPNFEHYWDQTVPAYEPVFSYCQSKLANLFFTSGLQQYLDKHKAAAEGSKGSRRKGKVEQAPKTKRKIKTVCLHPGVVDTGLFRGLEDVIPFFGFVELLMKPVVFTFMKSSLDGAQTTMYCSLCPFERLQAGEYYADCRVAEKSHFAQDQKNVDRCWEMTNEKIKELTGETIFE